MDQTLNLTDLGDTAGPLLIADADGAEMEWDRMLQSLVLQCSWFAGGAGGTSSDAVDESSPTSQAAPSSLQATLREARRTGALGELCEEAQTTLLSGTLYAYGGLESPSEAEPSPFVVPGLRPSFALSTASSVPIVPASRSDNGELISPPELRGLFSDIPSPSSAAAVPPTLETQADLALEISTLRSNLERALQARLGNTTSGGWLAEGGVGDDAGRSWGSTPVSVTPVVEPPEVHLRPATAQTEDFAGTIYFDRTARVFTSSMGSELPGLAARLNGTQAALGETVISESDQAFHDTLRPEEEGQRQAVDGGLSDILRRLVTNDANLDESLMRSVRRVLQLTTVLTGQRLSEDEIVALPRVQFERAEDQGCAICLETFQRGELLTELRCNHFFHVECVSRWFQRSAQCPLCRSQQSQVA